MFGMLYLPTAADIARRKEAAERRMASAVSWADDIKWAPELNIKADTFKALSLFPVQSMDISSVAQATPEQMAASPDGKWLYVEKRLPRGAKLMTASGKRQGDVLFDGPVVIPTLHERASSRGYWNPTPWMSITPFELLTLRPGTKRAKGTTVVAGLGLGHQLIEVSKRKQVKKLVLIERDRSLIDWLLPRITPQLARPIDEIIVDDAFEVLPKLSADVALLDVFPGYGGNRSAWLERKCLNIKAIWTWGA